MGSVTRTTKDLSGKARPFVVRKERTGKNHARIVLKNVRLLVLPIPVFDM